MPATDLDVEVGDWIIVRPRHKKQSYPIDVQVVGISDAGVYVRVLGHVDYYRYEDILVADVKTEHL